MSHALANRIRIVTATSLFDGHDAAINIMRRILQSKGAEVIHLGHNRSVLEIVEAAMEEDAHAVAVTSYQGGHLEFFKYLKDLLDENGCGHIRIFGGGGGTILPLEIDELQRYGICRIYSPDDGRKMGLEGMIDDLLNRCEPATDSGKEKKEAGLPGFWDASAQWNGVLPLGEKKDIRKISRAITMAELGLEPQPLPPGDAVSSIPVLGITGTGGAGKSSVSDELIRRFRRQFPELTMAMLCVDPSKRKSGGALLGDRIRMNSISSPNIYVRSLATRESDSALSAHLEEAIMICKEAGYDLILLESAGAGQGDASITAYCDVSLYVMTPEYGAASQLEKINMLDYADLVAINKFDKAGSADALLEVRKQYKRNHGLFSAPAEELPIVGTVAAQFNDPGVNELFERVISELSRKKGFAPPGKKDLKGNEQEPILRRPIIPSSRVRYLSEIVELIREYDQLVKDQAGLASRIYQLRGALEYLQGSAPEPAVHASDSRKDLIQAIQSLENQLTPISRKLIQKWPEKVKAYEADFYEYNVRNKLIRQPMFTTSLSGTRIRKVILPRYRDWGDILRWQAQENAPGHFPFTAGVFPLKRGNEDPTRMFAGEGGPERTNKRFHYLSQEQPAIRLSTAFDSVTLYGEDPANRPDVYGKVGNSGVSVATIDDAKKLYCGFDLCDPKTSVSMTINGPAPIILAFFLNAAIDQQCEKWLAENEPEADRKILAAWDKKFPQVPRPVYHPVGADGQLPDGNVGLGLQLLGLSGDDVLPNDVYEKIKREALNQVRGTIQADILKEDQAQNTCIFSTEFALRLMGDVQEYFSRQQVQNFYSVSVSGYHIAEAGANPITQLAFTLANGFTYVEYYLGRGMRVDEFAPNLSFFFSNGMDPEYSVIGRVARRIWAKAMKYKYKANKRSQMLKYHIQTSGRSLHAQEIDFNDIRTTLQALYAIYDNCNSLHTNAYDEAITTPTEESVRRAMAIQLIINRELGTAKNENPNQGSFLIEELTDLVEEAVLSEFNKISDRGGVLGAMERMYQRNTIQEESLYYENLKHSGELPIVGVNTFLNRKGSPSIIPQEVIRSSPEERDLQIRNLLAFQERNQKTSGASLVRLQQKATALSNLFEELMETVKSCSLGQITHALYEVGGQYRRNM